MEWKLESQTKEESNVFVLLYLASRTCWFCSSICIGLSIKCLAHGLIKTVDLNYCEKQNLNYMFLSVNLF